MRRSLVRLVLVAIISMMLLVYFAAKDLVFPTMPSINKGVLDLSHWKQEDEPVLNLTGEWEFYWNKILDNDGIESNRYDRVQRYAPMTWNSYKIDGKYLEGYGYATYRIRVKGYDRKTPLGFKILTMSTAYNILVDEQIIASCGVVGKSESESVAKYNTQTVSVWPQSEEFNIIIQVSNFKYARGGMWRPIYFGVDSKVREHEMWVMRKESFQVGILFIMSCYLIILYVGGRKGRSLPYVVAGLIIGILRILVTGQYYITKMLDISFDTVIYIEYLTLYWGPLFWALFMHEIFPKDGNKLVDRIVLALAVTLSVISAIVPVGVYTRWVRYIELYDFVIVGYAIFINIKAVLQRSTYGILLLYCNIMFLSGLVVDIIFFNILHNSSGGLFTMVIVLVVLLKAYIISDRFSRAMEISKMSEIAMLQAQIKPHFLHNAMNALADLSYEGGYRAYDAITSFSDYLRHSYDIIPNYEYICLKNEIDLVEAYLRVEKLRFGDRLDYSINMEACGSTYIIPFIIQPLVENAVRHGISKSENGGKVEVYGVKYNNFYQVIIKDNGMGMSEDVIKSIKSGNITSKGHGLSNVKTRLYDTYRAKINILSDKGKGTCIHYTITLNTSSEKKKAYVN